MLCWSGFELCSRWVPLFDVETDEAELLFVFDRFEPVDYGCSVFPLVEVVFFRGCTVDAVEDVFADFTYLGLRGVDESAGLFVCEVRLVILKCYECVFVGCSVHSVVDSQFCRDSLVFFMDCLRRLGLCFLVRFCETACKKKKTSQNLTRKHNPRRRKQSIKKTKLSRQNWESTTEWTLQPTKTHS